MIVTDLDGTLLRSDKTVTDRNRLALSRCREIGIKVVFATGRAYRTKIVPQDWFDGYVRSNGAYAYAGEVVVYKRTISDETMRYITDICTQQGLVTEPRLDEYIHLPEIRPIDSEYVKSILPADMYLIVLKEDFGQIMHKEAKKADAIEALARHWGINSGEIIAFGDDQNDINMLTWVGNGIAMGNAIDEVIAAADCVCDTNDNDGVAKWLEENVLCN